jgi:orotidine-5'-phosphate decarboxylase
VNLGRLALDAGCAGVVSSAREVKALRAQLGTGFLAVTPGVRHAGAAHGDQARVVTPAEAVAAGATHVVVGRPITGAPDPATEARKILEEIA